MPAAGRPHCILRARDLEMLALVFCLCCWSTNLGRLLVVYYRIAQISRLNLACAGPFVGTLDKGTFVVDGMVEQSRLRDRAP